MKRQFKHTQSSDIVESLNNGYYINIHTKTTIPGKYIENTNDWVEILPKPEYTILTLVRDITGLVLCSFDKHEEHGSYSYGPLMYNSYKDRDEWLKAFLQHSFWSIYSVRRESDGEVFTIGDNVRLNCNVSSIAKLIKKIAIEKVGVCPEKLFIYINGEQSTINNYVKVQPKEWEITSLISPYGPVPLTNSSTFDNLLNNLKGYTIRSIKRLSDNVEFKVGDKVDSTISDLGRPTDLTGFKVIDNKLTVGLRDLGYYPLSTIILPKKPLFTTEDGVDIYLQDNMTYFEVGDNLIINTVVINIKEHKYFDFLKRNSYMKKVFSSKEKAEEYILMNKPCLSINNIITMEKNNRNNNSFTSSLIVKNLKNLVKTKL